MSRNPEKRNVLQKISAIIIDYRYIVFLLFAVALVYCVSSLGKVKINSDLTAFLPADTETRQGLTVMEEEFTDIGSASVMVSNITYETAEQIVSEIEGLDHVTQVAFDDTEAHFKSASALFSISFDGPVGNEHVREDMQQIRQIVSRYDNYISTSIMSDYLETLAREMVVILLIAAAVIAGVLLLTSRSYFEVAIYAVVFVVAAILNMGTNFWLGEISSITNTIAVILQLALAIDYAIIFAHRYQDETAARPDGREALVIALGKSIVEISSSSLTTIAGLAALTLMQFRLGYDLGIVLAKGIICSMLTVFLLMPGLIMLFPHLLKVTAHKSFIPKIDAWGRFLTSSKYVFVIIFAVILPFAIIFSGKVNYAFSDSSVDELVYSESRAAMHKINDTFTPDTAVVVLVKKGDTDKEKAIVRRLDEMSEIKNVTALAGIRIDDTHVLTDAFTPRMFSELLGIDIEQATLLYQAYGVQHEEYQAIFGSPSSYEVPIIDMFLYLFEKMDQGLINLTDEQMDQIRDLREMLERGAEQLSGENWDRMVLTVSVPAEGEEATTLVSSIREMAEQYYESDEVLVIGDITSARDLRESYSSDSVLISVLTAAFVFVILLFTFRSLMGAVILVFVIQGSIWINFACTYLSQLSASFVTNMIVSAIQMGATIDYAIVLMSRYLALRADHEKKEAMTMAVSECFPTVMTSGTILTVAGFLIAYRISDVYVGHIGLAVGRGALISVILVLTVLPQLIVLFDKLVEKTKFNIKLLPGGDKE